MAQQTMYPGQVNSPQTELASAIDDTQTTIPLLDASLLPAAPNLLVIGGGEDAETVLYTSVDGNDLTGVTRGFQGTAKAWGAGVKVGRFLTAYDHDTARLNIEDHETRIVDAESQLGAATSAATPNTLAKYDASGRIKTAAPVAADDVAQKGTVDAHTSRTDNPHGTTYTQVGAAAAVHTHPATQVIEDSTHRFVTDTEKLTWNGKQNALGYTPVNKAGDTMTGPLFVPSISGITSTSVVTNLNADRVDGLHFRENNGMLEYSTDGSVWKTMGIPTIGASNTVQYYQADEYSQGNVSNTYKLVYKFVPRGVGDLIITCDLKAQNADDACTIFYYSPFLSQSSGAFTLHIDDTDGPDWSTPIGNTLILPTTSNGFINLITTGSTNYVTRSATLRVHSKEPVYLLIKTSTGSGLTYVRNIAVKYDILG